MRALQLVDDRKLERVDLPEPEAPLVQPVPELEGVRRKPAAPTPAPAPTPAAPPL